MVKEKVNYRVARYMLAMLATSAGMWNASTGKGPYVVCVYSHLIRSLSAPAFVICHVLRHPRIRICCGTS